MLLCMDCSLLFQRKFSCCITLILFLSFTIKIYSQNSIIVELKSKDSAFKEYIKKVEKNHQLLVRNNKNIPTVEFYTWRANSDYDFLSLVARCSLRQETIATLNGITNPKMEITGKKIILPTVNGLFIPKNPKTTLEHLLKKKYFPLDKGVWYTISGKDFLFIPDGQFSPTERAFFFDVLMRSPLPEGVLTSTFGTRVSPISGERHFHDGIDLAAPLGTSVYSCKSGVVMEVGYNDVYGNYVLASHDGKAQSFYAHLSKVFVKQGQKVSSGDTIGEVGTTGDSTGPHLHFEVHVGGKSIDPQAILKKLP